VANKNTGEKENKKEEKKGGNIGASAPLSIPVCYIIRAPIISLASQFRLFFESRV
jgi:hypothetical protein